ncbi:MAG: EAL domain-containing protein [Gammaproteobacteria bacterium]|nr:EAL domain-containing protein [Gammaproteobacteria bacterium]
MRLKPKLLSLLIPLLLIPLLGMAWVAYVQMHEQTEEKIERELSTLLNQLKMHSMAMMTTAEANLDLFANSSQLHTYMLNESESERYSLLQPSLMRLFASYQAAYPEYYEIRILLPDGYEDTRSAKVQYANVIDDESGTELFLEMQGNQDKVISSYQENVDDGRFVLYVGKAIKLRDAGQDPILSKPLLRGYLVLTVDLKSIGDLVTKSLHGADGGLFAIDRDGVIRMHADAARIGTSLAPDVVDALQDLGESNAEYAGLLDGERSHFQAAKISDNLWFVAAYPESQLRANADLLARTVAGITLLAVIILVAASFWFMNAVFIRPVQKLSAAARQVREGNLRVDLDVRSGDEIGDLAKAFREMGEGLYASQEQIRFHAYHDNLTGLPNRFMFREHLEQAVTHAKHSNEILGVLFADVDGFKRVNDTLGHHAGDELLKAISERVRSVVRSQDLMGRAGDPEPAMNVVSRIGGDEFVVLVTQMEYPVEAGKIAQRIIDVISMPFMIAGQEIYIGISIGIAILPADTDNAEDLLRHADVAMFHAKAAGKNNFQFYSRTMNAVATNTLALESRLHRAMERDELFLVYQPKIDLCSGRTLGVEALIRWNHPEEGMIPPDVFIPVAEEVGMINAIGEWVLRNACQQVRAWEQTLARDLIVAVNISSHQIANQHFGATVQKIIHETGLSPGHLEFEMTETAVMQMESVVDETFRMIRDLGITISLDDFGTGYSSLSHLRRFPINFLKIDRSFVDEALTNVDDRAIVSAIIGMAQNLGLQVVAEGVETREQADFLREKGCDFAQGYFFGRPMSAENILTHLHDELESAAVAKAAL